MAREQQINFEVVVKPVADKRSVFDETSFPTVETVTDYAADAAKSAEVARKLSGLGIDVHHIGEFSISASCPEGLFEKTFSTKLSKIEIARTKAEPEHYPESQIYLAPKKGEDWELPKEGELNTLIERAYVQPEPIFFDRAPEDIKKFEDAIKTREKAFASLSASLERPIPPLWGDKFRLRVPVDVSQLMRASEVQRRGITGKGVRVAMPDTGFYHHPYFKDQGYNFLGICAPDTINPATDTHGHGTGECANLFATAPGINFIGVKMGNPTLAFKTAVDLRPDVMTNSWGYSLDHPKILPAMPNSLKPLYLAALSAVYRGITVCFSAGNGHFAFPACIPQVIAVGGAHVTEGLDYKASDYASSFESTWFPGRKVPDICGLVGMKPTADYIELPVESGAALEKEDGWGAFSGTSAASPMVAGVCALLKQADPTLRPHDIKNILKYTARDIDHGKSAMGDVAKPGWDLATGYGLVDAVRAIETVL